MGLLVLTAALIPVPLAASDGATALTTPTRTAKTSLHDAVTREAARAAKTPMAPATVVRRDQGSSSNGVTHFFTTRPGVIALSVMAIGTGYAIYSANHDRITSPGRK